MSENLRKLNDKLCALQEEKLFIRKQINLNYAFPRERARLFAKMEKCENLINETKGEIKNAKNKDVKNRDTITTNNKEK